MNGTIYKIVCNTDHRIYIGSTTTTLLSRWNTHCHQYKRGPQGSPTNYSLLPFIRAHGGLENFKIIPIKTYQVSDRKHLEAYETLWINRTPKCSLINNNLPIHFNAIMKRKMKFVVGKKSPDKYYKPHKRHSSSSGSDSENSDSIIEGTHARRVQRKVPISLVSLGSHEEDQKVRNEYMRAYRRVARGLPYDAPLKKGRPLKYPADEDRAELARLRRRMKTHYEKTFVPFDFSPETFKQNVNESIEEYMASYLNIAPLVI